MSPRGGSPDQALFEESQIQLHLGKTTKSEPPPFIEAPLGSLRFAHRDTQIRYFNNHHYY